MGVCQVGSEGGRKIEGQRVMARVNNGLEGVGLVATKSAQIELPPSGFKLECGRSLPELTIAYETYGELSPRRDNVIFVCHALTGDAHAAGHHESSGNTRGWWDEMIGPGRGIDTQHYFVICANILGGCKGTTGPSSINPETGKPYGSSFPTITIKDMVEAHRLLLKHLNVDRLAAVIGGSLGGMQALEWAIDFPEMLDRCVCIATATSLSAQALAFDIVARNAITSDPDWQGGDYYGTGRTPARGLSQARKIGHITYLSTEMMTRKFGRERRGDLPNTDSYALRSNFQVESYLDHQGRKLVERFDANSYLHITRAMDEYDLVERFGSLDRAFEPIKAKMLVVALSSDWLFPPEQSVQLANALLRSGKRVSYCKLHAPHGHDGFLVDIEKLADVIRAFLPWVSSLVDACAANGGKPSGEPAPEAGVGCRHEAVIKMIRPGSRVLDLGCGKGDLLSMLAASRNVRGFGVDIDLDNVISVIDKGHDIFQGDIDEGLAMIPDNAYDYALLSETLQAVRKPRLVLHEVLRVAKEGIVSFWNFGNWLHRTVLSLTGRMPVGGSLSYEWHDAPNIHFFTLVDFSDVCRRDGIRIIETVCIPAGVVGRMFLALGFRNLGADLVVVRIEGK